MNYLTIPRNKILSNEEVLTAMARLMTAEGRKLGHGRVNHLLALCGGSRQFLMDIKMGKRQAPEGMRAALTRFLPMLERGELKFRRTSTTTGNQKWKAPEPVEVTWVCDFLKPPDPLPPPQPRVTPEKDYVRFARCKSCGFPRFSKFRSDKFYMACDGCVSDSDRVMLGAIILK